MKVFRIIAVFRILRPTFHRKDKAPKYKIRQIIIASGSFSFYLKSKTIDHLKLSMFVRHTQVLRFEFLKFSIFRVFELSPMSGFYRTTFS